MLPYKFAASVNIPLSSSLWEHVQKIEHWNRYDHKQSEYFKKLEIFLPHNLEASADYRVCLLF